MMQRLSSSDSPVAKRTRSRNLRLRKRTHPGSSTRRNLEIIEISDDTLTMSETKQFANEITQNVNSFFQSHHLESSDDEPSIIEVFDSPTNNIPQPSTSRNATQDSGSHDDALMDFIDLTRISSGGGSKKQTFSEFMNDTQKLLDNTKQMLQQIAGTIPVEEEKSAPPKPPAVIEVVDDEKDKEGASMDCPVCLSLLSTGPIFTTFCGHLFCEDCIKHVAKTLKKCPVCNCKGLTLKKIHRIYM